MNNDSVNLTPLNPISSLNRSNSETSNSTDVNNNNNTTNNNDSASLSNQSSLVSLSPSQSTIVTATQQQQHQLQSIFDYGNTENTNNNLNTQHQQHANKKLSVHSSSHPLLHDANNENINSSSSTLTLSSFTNKSQTSSKKKVNEKKFKSSGNSNKISCFLNENTNTNDMNGGDKNEKKARKIPKKYNTKKVVSLKVNQFEENRMLITSNTNTSENSLLDDISPSTMNTSMCKMLNASMSDDPNMLNTSSRNSNFLLVNFFCPFIH